VAIKEVALLLSYGDIFALNDENIFMYSTY
jgi:hypothetical protein